MDLCALIKDYRRRADDASKPYLYDDATVTDWFNEAVEEAAIRADLIFDADSPFCKLPIRANRAVYTLPKVTHKLAEAWLTSDGTILTGTDQSTLDRDTVSLQTPSALTLEGYTNLGCNWRTTTGRPSQFIQDELRLQLVPIPTADDTLNLSLYRIPTDQERMSEPDACPVIAARWHRRLTDWVMYRAYDNRDEEATDDQRAQLALARFVASFGERPDAKTERRRAERRSHTTRINWPS